MAADDHDPKDPRKRAKHPPREGESREDAVKKLAQHIRQGASKEETAKTHRALVSEEHKIEHLTQLIKAPPKSLMDSGNLPDLRRELAQAKSASMELASKIIEIQSQIRRIEQGRAKITADIDLLKAEETKLHETLAQKWDEQAKANEQLDSIRRQRHEEEIAIVDVDAAYNILNDEFIQTQNYVKESRTRLEKSQKNVKKLPDRINNADVTTVDNNRKISELEKRLSTMDKELAGSKAALEAAITSQRAVTQEYDRISSEKSRIDEAYALYDNIDKIVVERQRTAKSIEEAEKAILEREKALEELEEEKKTLKASLEAEEENQKTLHKELDANSSKTRSLDSKFTVYAELDNAAKDANEANLRLAEDEKQALDKNEKIRETQASTEKAKKELQELIRKEDQLKKKLEEVLHEKQRLEEDLQEISGDTQQEKLIIELPDVLRDAIKKETEKISRAQQTIEALEKTEKDLREEVIKLRDKTEDDQKSLKLKEKQLVYIKNKLTSSGYDEGERLILKRDLDSTQLERKETEAKIAASDAERKQLKSKLAKAERQTQKTKDEIEALHQQITDSHAETLRLDEETKIPA
jgi:chromosome segregation ATPase